MPKAAAEVETDERRSPIEIRDRVIELRRVKSGELVEHPRNWRTHPKAQIEAIEGAVSEIGFAGAILTRKLKGGKLQIIDGHARAELNPDAKLPVLVTDLTEKEADLFIASYDPLAAMAGRDEEAIKKLLARVKPENDALKKLLRNLGGAPAPRDGETDPDEIPEAGWHRKGKIKRGGIYLLGNHRILCGDSTKSEEVARVLGKAKPEIMVTDPPYGVDYDPTWRKAGIVGNGSKSNGVVSNDDRAIWTDAWKLFGGSVAYIWHSSLRSGQVETSITDAGFIPRSMIIWRKQHAAIGRGAYHWQHEPCFYAVRDGATASWIGGRKQTTVWDVLAVQHGFVISKDAGDAQIGKGEDKHSTQKPAELFRRPLQNHKCSTVFEPFAGSGTCIIAAEQTEKACLAIELEPKYVGVAIERWRRFTGLEPQVG